jgi:proline iminopeptidase
MTGRTLALALLAASPVAAQAVPGDDEWYLSTGDGCELYVVEVGEGSPVVALHGGFGAEHSYLLDAVAGLETDHRFILYDQRGSLRSPCPDSLISVDRHVEDLERLRGQLGLEQMVLVGHSMGSFLAMSYLDRYPDRVEGLVLLGALIPRTPQGEEEAALYRGEQAAFREWMDRPEVARLLAAEGLDGEELSDRQRTQQWRVRFAAANIYDVSRWRLMRGGRAFYNQRAGTAAGRTMPQEWDFTDALAALGRPVTVIMGDHDLVGFGGRLHQRLLGPLANVELILLERAGHNAWIDRPGALREHLRAALARY